MKFEPTIPGFGQAKTVHTLDRAATEIGAVPFYIKHYLTSRVFNEISNEIKGCCYFGSDAQFPSSIKPCFPGTSDKQGLESGCVVFPWLSAK
jgi:hypothetical protein